MHVARLMMRINKYLARSGAGSRRRADLLILQGRVKVNGKVVRELGIQIDDREDIVELDGKLVSPTAGAIYLMLNKPSGYLVSARDVHHKKLVGELLGKYKGKVFPVGRLDFESSGLLLFTNDGELAFRLSHPRYGVRKTYEAHLAGSIGNDEIEILKKGIILDDGPTAPAEAEIISRSRTTSRVTIIIHEGRKRQIRRMFDKLGFPVIELKRVAYGYLTIDKLREGEYRLLNPAEVASLKKLVGL